MGSVSKKKTNVFKLVFNNVFFVFVFKLGISKCREWRKPWVCGILSEYVWLTW